MRYLRAVSIMVAASTVSLFAVASGAGEQHAASPAHDPSALQDHTQADHTHHGSHSHDIVPCSYPNVHDVAIHHGAVQHGDHDHLALTDMQHYAAEHLSGFTPLHDSYGAAPDWAHEWELRWIDVDTGKGVVRVYHATNKHDDDMRFTSLWDGPRLRYTSWEPIH